MSAQKFESVKVGSVTVRLYPRRKVKGNHWLLADYSSGKRILRSFSSLEEGKKEAKRVAVAMSKGDVAAAGMSGRDRQTLQSIQSTLEPHGIDPLVAAAEYSRAFEMLGGRSILEAVAYFVAKNPKALPTKTVAEVAAEFYALKASQGKSSDYLIDCKSRHGKFATACAMPVGMVTADHIRQFLGSLGLSKRSSNNYLLAIRTLLNFAKAQGYLPHDYAEGERVEEVDDSGGEILIFSPAEMRELLDRCQPQFIPFLAIAAFAGVRSAELERLDWSFVDLEGGYIKLPKSITKTGARRLVPIAANLAEWLRPHRKDSGRVLPYAHAGEAQAEICKAVATKDGTVTRPAFNWKHNGARHSYVSYRVALVKSSAQVALECGNSPRVIDQSYRELVSEKQAQEYFSIVPTTA